MISSPHLLLYVSDPKLRRELEAAVVNFDGLRPVVHEVHDFRAAVEAVRSRRPDMVLVEMNGDMGALRAFGEEVAVASAETAVVGVFRPDVFGPEVSESAILIEAIRANVKDFLRRPISSFDVAQLFERLLQNRANVARTLGHVVSMISNKGGVGKSTLAVNAATGLALRHPGRVLLIDASLQMGVCASMLDVNPTTTLTDALRQQSRLDETLIRELAVVHRSGLHLLAAPDNAVEGSEIDDQFMSRILTLARRAYDYVVVDTFPMLDRVNMAVLDLSDRVYIVLENVVPTILSGAKLVELLDSLNFDMNRQRVVINRYSSRSGNLKPIDIARRLNRDVDHVLPFHLKVQAAANSGFPYVMKVSRFTTVGSRIRRLVSEIENLTNENASVAASVVSDAKPIASAV